MRAEQARKLSQAFEQTNEIDGLHALVVERIRKCALRGATEKIHPWDGLKINSEQIKALTRRLVGDGYQVKEFNDPDPGHPASRPYTTISW